MEQIQDVIAMDGPAASGKTTVGRLLADELGYLFLDTGCMYRAVTVAVLGSSVEVTDETAVSKLASSLDIDVQPAGEWQDGRTYTVLLNGQDVTWDLRLPEVDANVSQVSQYKKVREEMVRRQRDFGKRGSVVMIGRDIGTVVMPNAPLKLYVTASPEERARRRAGDRERRGHNADYEAILADVIRRDKIDSSREHSPLKPADDAIIIDTTGKVIDEVLAKILALVKEKTAV